MLLSLLLLPAGAAGRLSTSGKVPIPVILMEFQDVHFVNENASLRYFDGLLNSPGFSEDGAIGSVADYFKDNSSGAFVPEFELFGPVRLSKDMAYYGKNIYSSGERIGDALPAEAVVEACALAGIEDPELVLVIFAGYDESQGGPADALWAHQGSIGETGLYAFASELLGAEGERYIGAGHICHEIGHFLGLPDFYDTNGPTNGNSAEVYMYSLMSSGHRNNEGRTPPYLNAVERLLLGWMDASALLPLPEGRVKLKPIEEGSAYWSATSVDDEIFIYEARDARKWDESLPGGLLIYHLDRSAEFKDRWDNWRENNDLNATASHPCFFLIRSEATEDSRTRGRANMNGADIVFPGLARTLCYEPKDWSDSYTGVQITNISYERGATQIYVLKGAGENINGFVREENGSPVAGVNLLLGGEDGGVAAVSGSDGFFRLDLEEGSDDKVFLLSASKAGYRPRTVEVSRNGRRIASVPIILRREGEADETSLSKYDPSSRFGYFPKNVICASRFTASDLYCHVGEKLTEVSFYPYLGPAFEGDVYIIVDQGTKRVLNLKVEQLVKGLYFKNTVDISEYGIVVREGEDIYIGIGSPDASESLDFRPGTVYPGNKGNSYYTEFNLEKSSWKEMYVDVAGFHMDLALSAVVAENPHAGSLQELGWTTIDVGKGTYTGGDAFKLALLESPFTPVKAVSWFLDGTEVSGESIILTTGQRFISARIEYEDGRKEVLDLELNVR